MMTRKDYETIAGALREALRMAGGNTAKSSGVKLAALVIEEALAEKSERFDGDRFLAACGLEPAQDC
jgi:hypothetical protein